MLFYFCQTLVIFVVIFVPNQTSDTLGLNLSNIIHLQLYLKEMKLKYVFSRVGKTLPTPQLLGHWATAPIAL